MYIYDYEYIQKKLKERNQVQSNRTFNYAKLGAQMTNKRDKKKGKKQKRSQFLIHDRTSTQQKPVSIFVLEYNTHWPHHSTECKSRSWEYIDSNHARTDIADRAASG